ncbi:MAG: hypothetical protein GY832_00450 [Chloroflexi bacterium]|nr:hypothetical protein [Chloroflexota bacterium]
MLPYFSRIVLLGAASGTLFLAVLAGSVTVWFRRIRVGANVDGNADGGGVQLSVFGPPQAGDEAEGEADASL